MMVLLKKIMALFTAVLISAGVCSSPSQKDPVCQKYASPVYMQVALISDPQIWANSDRHWAFQSALEDIENNADTIDAVVVAGDLTESGDDPTDELVIDMLNGLSVEQKIIASGNHDVRLFYNKTMQRFISDVNRLQCAPYTVRNPYYYTLVNGYYFIVLGTDRQELERAYISDEQLRFLDETLAKATANGNPAFVICHQPLANTHGLPDFWKTGDLGKQSDAVAGILEKYDNVFFLSGHTHSGFWEHTFDSLKKTHLINIPTVGKHGSRGYDPSGTGFMMEVYKDCVVFRARSFSEGNYLGDEYPAFDAIYPLV